MKRQPPHRAIINELAMLALESDANGVKYEYSNDDLLNALVVFNSVLGTKLYDLGISEKQPFEIMADQAKKMGEELRLLIYTYTDIDTHDLVRQI
jgi:hypothetical protein